MPLGSAPSDDHQIRFRLLRKPAQNLGNIAAGNFHVRLHARLLLSLAIFSEARAQALPLNQSRQIYLLACIFPAR